MLLPFAAVVVAGMGQVAVEALRSHGALRRIGGVATAVGLIVAVLAAGPLWAAQLRGFLLADLDRPLRDAEAWMTQNAPADSRMLVDDAMWVDLVRAGFERENVVWYYKADTDTDVQQLAPDGWRDYDYVITTDSMRTFPTEFPTVRQAIENSAVVASFGEGAQKVDVRLVDTAGGAGSGRRRRPLRRPIGGRAAGAAEPRRRRPRRGAGPAHLGRRRRTHPADPRPALVAGPDRRGRHHAARGRSLRCASPARRQLVRRSGRPGGCRRGRRPAALLRVADRPPAPVSVERGDAGVVITFSPDEPVDLLPRPTS